MEVEQPHHRSGFAAGALLDIQAQLIACDFLPAVSDLCLFFDMNQDAFFELISLQARFVERGQKSLALDFYELGWPISNPATYTITAQPSRQKYTFRADP
jgi:hypothetical protein